MNVMIIVYCTKNYTIILYFSITLTTMHTDDVNPIWLDEIIILNFKYDFIGTKMAKYDIYIRQGGY